MKMNNTAVIIPISVVDKDAKEFINLCLKGGFGVIVAYIGDGTPELAEGVICLDFCGEGVGCAVRKSIAYARDKSKLENLSLICEPSPCIFDELENTLAEHLRHPYALTVCSVGKYANDTFLSKLGGFVTNTAYKFISGGRLNDLQPQIRCFSRCLFDKLSSVRGNGEEYYLNMLIELSLDNFEVFGVQRMENAEFHRKRIRFAKLFGMIFPYAFVSRFVKFALSSLFAFVIDYIILEFVHFNLSRTALSPPAVTTFSQFTARVFSSSVNFFVNYKIVFKAKGNLISSAVKYFSTVGLILLLQMGIMAVFDSFLKISIIFTPIIVQAITFFINYNIQRHIVYRRKRQ